MDKIGRNKINYFRILDFRQKTNIISVSYTHLVTKPMVLVSSYFKQQPYNFVTMDNEVGIYTVTEYLIQKGHRDIMLIGSSVFSNNYFYRRKGFYMALMDYGLDIRGKELSINPTLKGAYQDFSAYLKDKAHHIPTAFVASNDHMAISAIRALQKNGYQVPDDISVTGFDDIAFCQISSPCLLYTSQNLGKRQRDNKGRELLRRYDKAL